MRIILFPISFIYGLVNLIRNKLFDWKILPSKSFSFGVISVGNLSTGGTGKTPHVEYIIRLLKENYRLATLSRGYKRKSKGFVLADDNSIMTDIGDEPFQIKSGFPELLVAVDEKRVRGLENLAKLEDNPEVVLLDDAFQHRYIRPGMSILLTDYYNLYINDYPLPTGNLREFRSGARRADIIVVTKSPKVLSPITRKSIIEKINPLRNQQIFFSFVKHNQITAYPGLKIPFEINIQKQHVLLLTGIANPYPIKIYLKDRCLGLQHLSFSDHHNFTIKDMDKIILLFDQILSNNKIIITTEKDMMRILEHNLFDKVKHLPLYYLPIKVEFHKEDKEQFNQIIKEYAKQSTGNR